MLNTVRKKLFDRGYKFKEFSDGTVKTKVDSINKSTLIEIYDISKGCKELNIKRSGTKLEVIFYT